MNKIWQLLGLLLLFSCGLRKSHVNTQKDYKDSAVIAKNETTAKYKIKEETHEIKDFSAENFNFEITPNEKDTVIVTKIVKISDKNGNTYEIPYNSNAKVKFGSNKLTNKTETKTNKEIDSVKKENQFLKAQLKSVQKSKVKETEKKAPGFWQTVFGILGFSIVVIFLWEMLKKNFMPIINSILLIFKSLKFGKFK